MADKSISELVAATAVGSTDLFVLEQTGTAKKLTGQILENWLVSFADGHGGIQNIEYTPPTAPSLIGTLTITLADTTSYTVNITNGKGISSITDYWKASSSSSSVPSSWSTTRETMTSTNKYLWHYQHIVYNNNDTLDTTKCIVGVYGDTGLQTYVWIRYSAVQPTSDSDIGTTPDKYIGIYTGTASTAPTTYSSYTWYLYKGETGDTGSPATISSASVSYQQSDSGSVIPEGTWSALVPSAVQGKFLWTRISIAFNTGDPVVAYSVSRYGIDGAGSVVTVNSVSPDTSGNVSLTATNIPVLPDSRSVAAHLGDIESFVSANENKVLYLTNITCSAVTGNFVSYSNSAITANHVLVECVFANPPVIMSTVTWTTANGSLVINGTCMSATTCNVVLIKKDN